MNIFGNEFSNFEKACKYYEVDSSYLYKKSKVTGIPKEKLLEDRIQQGIKKYAFTYNGVKYANLTELCKKFNLDPVKVQSLMGNRKISREEAIDLSIKHNGQVPRNKLGSPVTVKGVYYPSRAAALREYKISESIVKTLIKKGYTTEEAILQASQTKGNSKANLLGQ